MRPAMKTVFWLAAMTALASVLSAQASPHPRQPIALIGDRTIYEDDLAPSIGGQLQQLKSQEYAVKAAALNNLVNQQLLEAQAKSTGRNRRADRLRGNAP